MIFIRPQPRTTALISVAYAERQPEGTNDFKIIKPMTRQLPNYTLSVESFGNYPSESVDCLMRSLTSVRFARTAGNARCFNRWFP